MAAVVVLALLASTISGAVAARAQLRSAAAGQDGASTTSYLGKSSFDLYYPESGSRTQPSLQAADADVHRQGRLA